MTEEKEIKLLLNLSKFSREGGKRGDRKAFRNVFSSNELERVVGRVDGARREGYSKEKFREVLVRPIPEKSHRISVPVDN